MIEKVYFNKAVHQLKAEVKAKQKKNPNTPDFVVPQKRNRKLAVQYGAFAARQEFRDYGERMSDHAKRLVENLKHPGTLTFTVIELGFDTIFGSVDTLISATAKAVHGLSGLIHPSFVIKKSPDPYISSVDSISSSKDVYSAQAEKADKKKKKKKKKKVENSEVKGKKNHEIQGASDTKEKGTVVKKKKSKNGTNAINAEGAEVKEVSEVKRKKKKKVKKSTSEKIPSGKSVEEMSLEKVRENAAEIIRQLQLAKLLEENEANALFDAINPGVKVQEELVLPDLHQTKAKSGFVQLAAQYIGFKDKEGSQEKKLGSIHMEPLDVVADVDLNDVLEKIENNHLVTKKERNILQKAIDG